MAERRHERHEYGQSWMLAAALLDGPRTFAEFKEYYRIMGRRFGIFVDLLNRSNRGMDQTLERGLQILLKRGWAVKEDEVYRITEEGRKEARLMLADLERGGRFIDRATSPETVSKVTLIVHFILAAIKLPAALLSGSVGLLNDSLDTLMDGISSLFVFFGVRKGKERQVSYLLLLFMICTGAYTLYEAIVRIIRPQPLTADWTAFIAVAVSAGLCALLWVYQKYAGLKHSCVPLIAQSIDSRNHIIVAGGVAAGLTASLLHFSLLDKIVGIIVAILILKGAVELLLDLLRSRGEEEIDLSKYGFSRLEQHRHRQMVRWFLFEIEKGRITSKQQMLNEARMATDFSSISSFRALGIDNQTDQEEKLRSALKEAFDRHLVVEVETDMDGKVLRLTESGEKELNQALSNNWSFERGSKPTGWKGAVIQGLIFIFRFLFTIVHFAILYIAIRWVLSFLPALDVWQGNAFGPFPFSLPQFLCIITGIIFMYSGRLLIHGPRHLLHHASERGLERPVYLITDGPFAVRRHPLYAGIILTGLGIGIGLHSAYTLAWAGITIIIRLLSIRHEEKQLLSWFGGEYAEYRRAVKRRLFSWPGWILLLAAYGAAWAGITNLPLKPHL